MAKDNFMDRPIFIAKDISILRMAGYRKQKIRWHINQYSFKQQKVICDPGYVILYRMVILFRGARSNVSCYLFREW